MIELPKLKKKVSAFLTKEDGKISKEKLLKTGVLIATLGVLIEEAAGHSSHGSHGNGSGITISGIDNDAVIEDNYVSGSHTHHAHHGSHGSHGSHGQW